MFEMDVRIRSRRAALLQLAAEELRRAEREGGQHDGGRLAQTLDRLAARLLVQRSLAPSG